MGENFRNFGLRARRALKISGITLRGPENGWIASNPAREAFPRRFEARAKAANPIAVSARPHGTQSGKCLVAVSAGYPKPALAGHAAPWGCLQLSDKAGAARDI